MHIYYSQCAFCRQTMAHKKSAFLLLAFGHLLASAPKTRSSTPHHENPPWFRAQSGRQMIFSVGIR